MSQMSRATRPPSSSYGSVWRVARSGRSTMSDSSIRTNPSMEEPSNMMSPSSAFSNWLWGTSTFLLTPRMSVNWSRRNATSCFFKSSRMSRFVAPADLVAVVVMGSALDRLRSDVVVQEELVRMRPQRHRIHFLGPLVREPGLDHVGREHVPSQQELVIGLERRQRFGERTRRVLDVLALRRLELVQIHVHRLWRLGLVLDALQPRQHQPRKREEGVAFGIRRPILDPLRPGRLRIHR